MPPSLLHVDAVGMCCSVGHSADAASAAIRAGMDHFQETDFMDANGQPLLGAPVSGMGGSGIFRLAALFKSVLWECLRQTPSLCMEQTALLLLVAEQERPGFPPTWAQDLYDICTQGLSFHEASRICPWGKAALGPALLYGRGILEQGRVKRLMVIGVDSYLFYKTTRLYIFQKRLLVPGNSDGFIPGEGAGAALISLGQPRQKGLFVSGIGCAEEPACLTQTRLSNMGRGMSKAIRNAVAECSFPLAETHMHLSDCSGEAFFFREIITALTRCFEHDVPAYPHVVAGSCLGETGAAVGPLLLAHATRLLCRPDGYGNRALLHCSGENGACAALMLEYV